MKTFLFIFLAGYAVRCDDSNYYVVQMPDNDFLQTKDFRVYWNVPTMQCKSRKIYFEDLYEKYGILQNAGDTFRGDKISILYDPGDFPALLRNSSSGEIKYRNGGVPQEGNLIRHLDTFQKVLEQSVPDKNFDGVGIIDFESWRPVLRQNFGTLTPYKDVSYEIEKKRHWWWKKQWIEEEAKRRFEEAGREFMQTTVSLSKTMRPHAVWGYYGFPYCFNMAAKKTESCADGVPQENDRINWLWQESSALYPSVYSSDDITPKQLAGLIRGRVKEAARVAARGAPILPYFWYRYRDKEYFTESDLDVAFSTLYKSNASGFIIWGSSNDVNTMEKCVKLKKYVTDILGPAVAKYTKRNMRLGDDSDETYNEVFNPNNASKFDPEYTWIPPVNYTQKIEEMVEKELKEEKEAALAHKDTSIKESILVDMILHKIANYCAEGCDNKSKARRTDEKGGDGVINESRVVLVTENPFKKSTNGIGVTVQTTTEEDIYDYDTDATGDITADDIYETNEYIVVSTTRTSIEQISTTIKSVEENKTTAKADEISILDISKEESSIFNINKEQHSTVDVTNEESSTISIITTEADENRLIIKDKSAVDLSTEEINSTEESITEISATTSTESSINEISITSFSAEGTSILKNDLIIDNSTESNSIEVDFIDISTEESSTINPITIDSTTIEPSTIDDGTKVSINSAAVNPSTVDNGSTIETKSATVEPSTVDNGTTVESKSATVEPSTVDNGTTVESKSDAVEPSTVNNGTTIETESATVEPSTVDNGTTVESKSATVEPSTVDNGTTVESKSDAVEPSTVNNGTTIETKSATVEPSTVDNGTTVESKSATVEPSTVDNGTTVESKSATVEPSTVDNGTTVESKSATVEPSTVDNGTTVESKSATVEPSTVDNGTTVGTKSDSSTTVAPVLTEQVVVSVV